MREGRPNMNPGTEARHTLEVRPPGSTAVIEYDDRDVIPSRESRRLEATLRCLFPASCGVSVRVQMAWSEISGGWHLRSARATLDEQCSVDISRGLARSCLAAGVPVVVGLMNPSRELGA